MSKHDAPAPRLDRAHSSRRRRATTLFAVLASLTLLALLVLADFMPPGREWWASHPMTSAATSALLGSVAIGVMVQHWLKEQEAAQRERISTVAYRGLAQSINDTGRNLLAPVVGADLEALAIPSSWGESTEAMRGRLDAASHPSDFAPISGWWLKINSASHGHVFDSLLQESEFISLLFLSAARERRRLQDATSAWAPVMLISGVTTTDLGRLRYLTDALEMLEEVVRPPHIRQLSGGEWSLNQDEHGRIARAYWGAIRHYERLGDEFASAAALPSDELAARRARSRGWRERWRRAAS